MIVRRFPFAIPATILSTLVLLTAAPAAAQSNGVGLGFVFGEPTGVSAKMWSGPSTAIAGGLAWSLADEGATNVYGDFLWHSFGLFDLGNEGLLPLYFGVGGRLQFEEDTRFGIRGVVGLDYIFPASPIDAFLELVPLLDISPDEDFSLTAAIGVRYFFR